MKTKRHRWTKEEIRALIALSGLGWPPRKIAEHLSRTIHSIRYAKTAYTYTKRRYKSYSKKEDLFILENYTKKTLKELAREPIFKGRSAQSIQGRAHQLGVWHFKKRNLDKDEIQELAKTHSVAQIAKIKQVYPGSISYLCKKHKITPVSKKRIWTPEEENRLLELRRKKISNRIIALVLDRPLQNIHAKWYEIKRKPKANKQP